jgi:hypothetical protein
MRTPQENCTYVTYIIYVQSYMPGFGWFAPKHHKGPGMQSRTYLLLRASNRSSPWGRHLSLGSRHDWWVAARSGGALITGY